MTLPARTALVGLGALGILPVLASCAATSAPAETSASYADGKYTATGEYTAPSGPETIEVTLTLADDVVTAVEVVGDATDRTAQDFQGRFVSGIAELVVGVDIDQLDVHRVAGSSLTSAGFRDAVATIKAEALES